MEAVNILLKHIQKFEMLAREMFKSTLKAKVNQSKNQTVMCQKS